MISDGLIIMAVGMLVVFAFLALMVISMRSMSSLVLKFFPEKEEPAPVRKAAPASAPAPAASDDAELAVAIAAAYTMS